ncbi:MAG: hypothetical protein A2289_02555 [Deltaproteobacteria bacterium RIFOXYA12_FULL_58_15]|nr:MAG: hypothetical protein A2289_02555 [Deltaproteobacteria bacterium RIFOXYA12_FULL_58_15]OGR09248.1 MAG: hypothetical protein A2341_24185 [Deltaproteobacteria bacterium RIFOXYB12_FULL_58_9]
MSKKKLESFKIGDTRKPGISQPKAGQETSRQAASEAASLGFRRIETILENDEVGTVSASLNQLLQSLESLERKAGTNKDKVAAKRAIVAVERTADLLDYLFQTKAQMAEST